MSKKQNNKKQSGQGNDELQVVFVNQPRSSSNLKTKRLGKEKEILQTLLDNTKEERGFKKMAKYFTEKTGEGFGFIVWTLIYGMGFTVMFLFATQVILNVLNISINNRNIVLMDIVIPYLDYMPLSLLTFLSVWVGVTIYFYLKLKKPINTNQQNHELTN